MRSRRGLVVAVLAAVTLGGCAHSDLFGPGDTVAISNVGAEPMTDPEVIIAKARAGVTVAATTGIIVEPGRDRPYLLDAGDRLRIFVYGQPNLSRAYVVDQSGNVSVPLIGNIRARGHTTTQLEGAIRSRLARDLVRDPQVTVDIQQHRPFFVLGEVRSAGQYPYVPGLTVETAVATAGGYGDRANERRARVTRKLGNATEIIEAGPDFELEPGDSVYIHERFF